MRTGRKVRNARGNIVRTRGALLLIAAFALAPVAAAQTPVCKITTFSKDTPGGYDGGWYVTAQVGKVANFGDLKVRFTQISRGESGYLVVDVKTPDFSVVNLILRNEVPEKFVACGVEVTLTAGVGENHLGGVLVGVF